MRIDTINRHRSRAYRHDVRRLDSYPVRHYRPLRRDDKDDEKEELTKEEVEFLKKLFAKKEAILEFLDKGEKPEEKEEEVVEEEIEPDEEPEVEEAEEYVEEFPTEEDEEEETFDACSKFKRRDSKKSQLNSVGSLLKANDSTKNDFDIDKAWADRWNKKGE